MYPPLDDWSGTRDTIHAYVQVIGAVRRVFAPRRKYLGHLSLRVTATGVTTRPFAAGDRILELALDLSAHRLIVSCNRGDEWRESLVGQSSGELCERTLGALKMMDVRPEVDRSLFTAVARGYDTVAARRFLQALTQINAVLQRFAGELREETSAVELWPEHFDLAVLWFSGRKVPGQDPANESWADEQMNFGFVTGDDSVHEPYFYATAYPLPASLPATRWPEHVRWHADGWQGAWLPYATLVGASNPNDNLLTFLRAAQRAGSSLMR